MLTETQAWQKIYDAFERYENGEFNRLAATGICSAASKLGDDGLIYEGTRINMIRRLAIELRYCGFDPDAICWPITFEGAASRCEFIREHFLPAGTSESTEAKGILNNTEAVAAAADQP